MKYKIGTIIKSKVISIEKKYVILDSNLKSESYVSIEEFKDDLNNIEVKIGDLVDVFLEKIENEYGETIVSRKKAKTDLAWNYLIKAKTDFSNIVGKIKKKVKGGYIVQIDKIKAFLPGSLVDSHPVNKKINFEDFVGCFKVIKLNRKKNNVILSRRIKLFHVKEKLKAKYVKKNKVGTILRGYVKNITNYGCFVKLKIMDGLLHITDISWMRIKSPWDYFKIGNEILVKVIKVDYLKNRLFLGYKQLSEDPWYDIVNSYSIGNIFKGEVVNITEYGCFVHIGSGIEGLVYITEIDWTVKYPNPRNYFFIGKKIKVSLIKINKFSRKISLSYKKCLLNPWKKFVNEYKVRDLIIGKVKSIVNFGIFVILKYNINALVHISNISWKLPGYKAIKNYKINDLLTLVILQINIVRKRISLGIKQLISNSLYKFLTYNKKGFKLLGSIRFIRKKFVIIEINRVIKGIMFYNNNINLKLSINKKIVIKLLGFNLCKKLLLFSL